MFDMHELLPHCFFDALDNDNFSSEGAALADLPGCSQRLTGARGILTKIHRFTII